MKLILLPITLPLSLLYGLITFIRNKFFDWGWYKELEFEVTLINVGNLAVGGTGKTPHVAYLISLLSDKKIAVLSRGYGRGTKGYRLVSTDSKPIETGDEILILKYQFPEVPMAVHESRALGITELLAKHQDIEIILLDDAFQHRHVKPQLNILLSEYDKPFYRDWVMPLGRLREYRSGYKRSDAIVFTKCPADTQSDTLKRSIDPRIETRSFFSKLDYADLERVHGSMPMSQPLLVTSIAKPKYLYDYLISKFPELNQKKYRDHYLFTQKDIAWMLAQNSSIICTSKDWIKIQQLQLPDDLNIWVQDVEIKFIDNKFDQHILNQINNSHQ
jgi:tetraacyldisaccharide 4'-kinase